LPPYKQRNSLDEPKREDGKREQPSVKTSERTKEEGPLKMRRQIEKIEESLKFDLGRFVRKLSADRSVDVESRGPFG